LINTKKIKIIFHKTKSHSKKNTYHNIADQLAKQGNNKPIIQLNLNFSTQITHFSWNQHIIPFKLRNFMKTHNFIYTLNKIVQLKPLRSIPPINTKLFFQIINSENTNIKIYSLRLKIILNNLPTMENLKIRYPNLYLTSNCTRCNHPENTIHLITCTQNNINIEQILLSKIIQTTNQITSIQNSHQLLYSLFINYSTNSNISISNLLLLIIQGLFPLELTNQLQTLLRKNYSSFSTNLSNQLINWFNTNIWQHRNTYQHEWEKQRGISTKTKQNKSYKIFSSNSNTANTLTTYIPNTDITLYIQKWFTQNYSPYTCII
jgi:hypothetical protein